MGYSQVTFQQLSDLFALRLADPTRLFWIEAEMESYLIEALRTWQALTAFLSVNVPVTIPPNTVLLDLYTAVPTLAPSVTDRQLILDLQRSLMEPTNATTWVGSEQFNYPQLVAAIQKRLDKFILETGIRLSISEQAVAGNPVALADSTIDVRRAMWKDAEGVYSVMWKADPTQLAAYKADWLTATSAIDPPTDYTVGLQMPLVLELTPTPVVAGTLSLLTVQSRPTLDPANVETILGIPDDLVWVIKWGALAEIFVADGPGEDQARATYAEQRWQQGIALARIYNTIRHAFINGAPAFIDALSELDQADPSWVSALADVPQYLAAAQNILACSPIMDNSAPSVTLDITPKFPIPALGGFVQIGKENISTILDYAEHIAHFKEGMSEITASSQLFKNMIAAAQMQNDRLKEVNFNLDTVAKTDQRENHNNPRRQTDTDEPDIAHQG